MRSCRSIGPRRLRTRAAARRPLLEPRHDLAPRASRAGPCASPPTGNSDTSCASCRGWRPGSRPAASAPDSRSRRRGGRYRRAGHAGRDRRTCRAARRSRDRGRSARHPASAGRLRGCGAPAARTGRTAGRRRRRRVRLRAHRQHDRLVCRHRDDRGIEPDLDGLDVAARDLRNSRLPLTPWPRRASAEFCAGMSSFPSLTRLKADHGDFGTRAMLSYV